MAFRGTSLSQNSRFGDKQAKLLKTTKFPSIYANQVDTSKVNLDVMRDWTTGRLIDLLGFDDDIVTEMVFEYLDQPTPDPKVLHINLLGFLEEKTTAFMKELWSTLLSAMKEESGIPRKILEDKINKLKEHVTEERLAPSLAPARAPPTRQPEPYVADIQRNVPVRPPPAPAAGRSASPDQPLEYRQRVADPPLESRPRSRSPPPRRFETTHNTLHRPRSRSRSRSPPRYPPAHNDRNRDAPHARRNWSRSRSRSRSPAYRRRRASPSPSPPRYARGQRRAGGYSRSRSPSPYTRERSRSASPMYYQDTRGRPRPSRSPSPVYYRDTRGGRDRSPYQAHGQRSPSPALYPARGPSRSRSRSRSRGRSVSRSPLPPRASAAGGSGWAGRLTDEEVRRRQQRSPSWSSASGDGSEPGGGSPAGREAARGRSASRSLSRERERERPRKWSRSRSRSRGRRDWD